MQSITGPAVNHFPVQVGASRFPGPHFISNLEGTVLEARDQPDKATTSKKFTGERKQQWLIQAESNGSGRIAVVSMHDGRYLVDRGLASSIVTSAVTVTKPSYWTLTEMRNGVYSLTAQASHRKLTIPTNVGQSCVSKVLDDGDSSIKSSQFLILRDTEKVRSNLRSGAIGCYAYSEQDIYYSVGDPEKITIMNHLSTSIYAAVSGAGMGIWENTGQWAIEPENTQYWLRANDESAHVSRPGSIGGQPAQVHAARSGMILHIQKMPSQQIWQGIQSVAVHDAQYTNSPTTLTKIGIRNKTRFDIHVSVFSVMQGGNTKQYSIKPGLTEYWNRTHPETVFVSVGSSPGVPKAYLGRPGFVLNITSAI